MSSSYDPTEPQPSISYIGADTLRTNSSGTVDLSRGGIAHLLGESHDGDRQRWDSLGYPREITTQNYRERYERGDIAPKIVDKPPMDTWREQPEIIDDAESEERLGTDPDGHSDINSGDETPFEAAVQKLFDGEHLRRGLLHRLHTADKLARLFEYSVIVIGTDGKKLSQPLNFPDENDEPSDEDVLAEQSRPYDGLDDINYIGVFSQESVEDIDREDDMNDSRYGLVKSYEITPDLDADSTSTGDSIEVHHTRAIHVPGESTDSDDLFSTPVLKAVWNRLEDLEKLLGGGAEMFWRAAYPGIVISRDPDVVYNDDGDNLSEQIEEYEHDMRRTLFPTGADVKMLNPTTADPSGHIPEQLKMISAAVNIPQNMLTGNELGDRATSEDRRTYHEFILSRMRNYAETVILRPILDRLVEMGIIPAPEGGSYTVEWPSLSEPTEQERAEISKTRMEALSTASGGRPETLASDAELREQMFMKPEYGAEAPDHSAEEPEPDEPPAIDESNPQVRQQFEQAEAFVTDGGSEGADGDGDE